LKGAGIEEKGRSDFAKATSDNESGEREREWRAESGEREHRAGVRPMKKARHCGKGLRNEIRRPQPEGSWNEV